MNLHRTARSYRYFSAIIFILFSSTASANEWDYNSAKGKNCVIISEVSNKETARKIGTIGIIQMSHNEMQNFSEFENDVFNRGVAFILEMKNRFKVEKGVGVNISSKSINISMDYTPDTNSTRDNFIYLSPNLDSLAMVDALINNEDLLVEFNTPSHELKYGIIYSEGFKKAYKNFQNCLTSL